MKRRGRPPKPKKLNVDQISEQPLSTLIQTIESLLKPHYHSLTTVIESENGKPTNVVLEVRFPIKEELLNGR